MTPEERGLLAENYVLGTLDAGERKAAAALIDSDPAFAAAVRALEDRLAPLDDDPPLVEPPARVLETPQAAIDPAAPGRARAVLAPTAEPVSSTEAPTVDPRARLADSAGPADVIDLGRKFARWRAIAAASMALAAGLAAVVVIDRLPAPPSRDTGRYMAVVNTDGSLPAMIVDVDTANGLVTVRPVAAEQPSDRNLELWAIPEGGLPVSLGLIDPADPVLRIRPDRAGVIPTRGLFAVSVEPIGGSPTGAPTGPVVYSGALVPTAE